MRRLALSLLFAALPAVASAETIHCTFTEPFVTIVHDTGGSTAEMITPDGTETIDGISFAILGPADFELRDAAGAPWVSMTLDYRGSDGMSDFIFPFSALWHEWQGTDGPLDGGCWSNNLPRVGGEQ